jgi:hypothetical protein
MMAGLLSFWFAGVYFESKGPKGEMKRATNDWQSIASIGWKVKNLNS